MVIAGLQVGEPRLAWLDRPSVGPFRDLDPSATQGSGHRLNAIALVVANVLHSGNRDRAVGKG